MEPLQVKAWQEVENVDSAGPSPSGILVAACLLSTPVLAQPPQRPPVFIAATKVRFRSWASVTALLLPAAGLGGGPATEGDRHGLAHRTDPGRESAKC